MGINVCLTNDSFPPVIDGVANVVVNYATELTKKGNQVYVAVPEDPHADDHYPFPVLRYPSIDTVKHFGYRTGVPYDLSYLSQYAKLDIDIIHTHCPITSCFLGRILRDTLKKPLILTYHTKYDIDIRRAISGELIQDAAIRALVKNVEACDEVWTVSKGAGDNLRSLGYAGDIVVMENGVDFVKGIPSLDQIGAVRRKYRIPMDRPVYLFVGRMMWYKGLRIILDALAMKKQAGQKFSMLLVGGGGDIDEVKAYARELGLEQECLFAGPVSDRKELKAIFAACDLFLFPSTFDTNGIVVREAASSGLASVLIAGSCAAEGTISGRNCIQIDENALSLAKVLIEAGDHTEGFHVIGQRAMEEIYLSWEDAVTRAENRYAYIKERYVYNQKVSLDPADNFFMMMSDLSKGLSEVHRMENDLRDFRDDLRKYRENLFTQMKDEFEKVRSEEKRILRNMINQDEDGMEVVLRSYTEYDVSAMCEIWNQVVEDGNAFPQETCLTETEGRNFFEAQTYCGVAEDKNGQIVGMYVLHPNNIGRCNHIANASFAVSKLFRGQHIGEKLVKDCMEQAALHGFGILQFNAVVASNEHARHLYERLGFTQLGTIPNGFRLPDGTYEDICPYFIEL